MPLAFPVDGFAVALHGVGDPQVPLAVDVDPVRPNEQTRTEALDKLPIQIKEHDRIQIAIEAVAATAALENPDISG
jgi:hypothetical protein